MAFRSARNQGVWRPLSGVLETPAISYLHERQHKRELRPRQRPRDPLTVAESTYLDQERNLLFNLRNAFVQAAAGQGGAAERPGKPGLLGRELDVNRTRFKAGDMAQVDLNRLELQRVQFESDYETALVNLRTAKIQL